MTLDADTVKLITALVVHVAGGMFVLETMLRKDDRAGRVWALGFIAAMIATEAYLLDAVTDAGWWPIAIGNASWVTAIGLLWIGCRVFNGRQARGAAIVVGAAAVAAVVAVLLELASGAPVGDGPAARAGRVRGSCSRRTPPSRGSVRPRRCAAPCGAPAPRSASAS